MNRSYRSLILEQKTKQVSPPKMKVVVFTDTHINTAAVDNKDFPNLPGPPMFYYTARKKLEQVVGIINTNPPDVVLFLGDAIDGANHAASFAMFMDYWNLIDPSIIKAITPGNHDYTSGIYDNELGLSRHDYVSQAFGYQKKPLVAGSRFNESYPVYSNGLGVRFINFETNIQEDGEFGMQGGYLPQEEIDWIENELLKSTENLVFLYAHRYLQYINESDRNKLENMFVSVVGQRPELKLNILYGHTHRESLLERKTLIGGFPLYNFPAIVDNLKSEFFTVHVSEEGVHSFESHIVDYNA